MRHRRKPHLARSSEPHPPAEGALAQVLVQKPALAKAAPARKPATVPDQALAWAPDPALLLAAAQARATGAARVDSPASPFRVAPDTTAQGSWLPRFRVALLRLRRPPTV